MTAAPPPPEQLGLVWGKLDEQEVENYREGRGGVVWGAPETPVRGLFVSPLTHEGLLHGQVNQGSANLHDSRPASHKDDTSQLCKLQKGVKKDISEWEW